jgi:hypothetical protein
MDRARNFRVGDRVRLGEDHLSLEAGTCGRIVRIENAWRPRRAPKKTGRIVFVRFEGVFGTVGVDRKRLAKQPSKGHEVPAGAAMSLLREMVDLFKDRPYQALGKKGPYICLFCGETTDRERTPKHMEDCPWPRVLALVGKAIRAPRS